MYEGGKSYWMMEEEEEEQLQMMMMPSPSVDCTLSLGTPSTRVYNHQHQHQHQRLRGFSSSSRPPKADPRTLLPRRCANCDTTSTPLWRNGPRGPKSLCNACGIRFKKEERRASAAAAQPTAPPCYSSPYQEFRFITFVD